MHGRQLYPCNPTRGEVRQRGRCAASGFGPYVDRLGGGADILQLNGCAKQIVDKGKVCNGPDD